jgi:hypothetical protein
LQPYRLELREAALLYSQAILELQIQPQKAEGKEFKKPIDLAKPAPSSRPINSNKNDYIE